jgi:hypothetical protein
VNAVDAAVLICRGAMELCVLVCGMQVKCLLLQLLEAMAYVHDNWVIHRFVNTPLS